MLLPPLARAACRPTLHHRLRPQHASLAARVFTSSPLHRKHAHGQRIPAPASKEALPQPNAAQPAKPTPLLAEQTVTNKEQRKADWAIIKEMSHYLWPKDNLGTRARVGLSVALLVGAKLLNVQVPFYFKNIVDSMNIDFAALGGTAWTVAGSMIVACKNDTWKPMLVTKLCRRCDPHRRDGVPRSAQRGLRQCRSEGYQIGCLQSLRTSAEAGPELPSVASDWWLDASH